MAPAATRSEQSSSEPPTTHPASWTREQEFEESFLRLGLLELLRGQGRFHLRAAALAAGGAVLLAAGDLAGDPPSLAEACAGHKGQVLASGPVLADKGGAP